MIMRAANEMRAARELLQQRLHRPGQTTNDSSGAATARAATTTATSQMYLGTCEARAEAAPTGAATPKARTAVRAAVDLLDNPAQAEARDASSPAMTGGAGQPRRKSKPKQLAAQSVRSEDRPVPLALQRARRRSVMRGGGLSAKSATDPLSTTDPLCVLPPVDEHLNRTM